MNAPFTPGTHLVTDRTLYEHHGIYVGDGRVVHYAGLANGWESGPVEEVSLEQFANGERVFASVHSSRFSGAEIVARARSRLGENLYDLFRNNCEHFSQWCVTGRRRSRQVREWMTLLPNRLLRAAFGWCADAWEAAALAARLSFYGVESPRPISDRLYLDPAIEHGVRPQDGSGRSVADNAN